MKKFIGILLILGITTSPLAVAGDYDGSSTLLCATQYVSQCDAGTDCVNVFPADVKIPDFFVVDATAKELSAVHSDRTTPVERIEHLDGKLILQGADDGLEDVRDGLAWSMLINEDTGKMIISAAGDDFAMVVFGACAKR
ncbi:MAG: hypothetical protein ABFS22_10170 [Pseudomonadota bacterium]